MNLDPQQMQHVSRTLAGVFHETAVVESLTRADNAPRARSLPAVSRDLDQLEASVSISHRHGPLAVLCTRLSAVPREQRAATLDLLFDAAQKCESPFEPLTELFRQTENWPVQDRGPYLARMMDAKGGAAAKVAASADDVLAYDGLPRFVEDLTQLAPEEQPAVLGVLAKQLLGLHHLQAHDFMKICEDFHELPWPRAAAAGLLGKIGWLRPDVHERMTALSRQPA